jgi:hypothetical protein
LAGKKDTYAAAVKRNRKYEYHEPTGYIDVVCTKSNNLFNIIGDCGDEYR